MRLMPPTLLCLSIIAVHISLTSNLPPTSQHQYSIPAAEQGPQLADDMLGLQMLCPSLQSFYPSAKEHVKHNTPAIEWNNCIKFSTQRLK